jgi:serine protease Do
MAGQRCADAFESTADMWVRRAAASLLAVLALLVAAVLGFSLRDVAERSATPARAQATTDLSTAVRDVAARVRPAVVQITSHQLQVDQFNQPFALPAGVGSGVIYDSQGYILTNNHVVEGASTLLVSLPDGRSFRATLIGADPQTDLAVVQIQGDSLPIAELGDSSSLQVGDWVVAIGNALALPRGPTVTQGVVSALNRSVQLPGDTPQATGPFLFGLVQTDASINPGNSGGPLANLAAEVIGINTLVAGHAEPGIQAQGIGFAISMAVAKPIADELVTTGRVVHPYVGVGYTPLTPALVQQLGIGEQSGVVITRVAPESPAAQAGLRMRDVVVAVDGEPLSSDTSVAEVLAKHKVGDTIMLTVLRGTQSMQVPLVLAARPSP